MQAGHEKSDDMTQQSPTAGSVRLPCRGCSSDCMHYAICDGRPWRTLVREPALQAHPSKGETRVVQAQNGGARSSGEVQYD